MRVCVPCEQVYEFTDSSCASISVCVVEPLVFAHTQDSRPRSVDSKMCAERCMLIASISVGVVEPLVFAHTQDSRPRSVDRCVLKDAC